MASSNPSDAREPPRRSPSCGQVVGKNVIQKEGRMKEEGQAFLRTQLLLAKHQELREEATKLHRDLLERATELHKVCATSMLRTQDALSRANGVQSYAPTKLGQPILIFKNK